MNFEIVIYKSIFGNFDDVGVGGGTFSNKIQGHEIKFTHHLFTDEMIKAPGWQVTKIDLGLSRIDSNRYVKFHPWKFINVTKTCYLDGRIDLDQSFYDFLCVRFIERITLGLFPHRAGGTVFDELIRNIDNDKITIEELQSINLKMIDFSKPALECGLLIRDHSVCSVREHGEAWWEAYQKIVKRDQLTFHSACDVANLCPQVLDGTLNRHDIKIRHHKYNKLRLIKARLIIALRILLNGLLIKR